MCGQSLAGNKANMHGDVNVLAWKISGIHSGLRSEECGNFTHCLVR